MKKEQVLEGNKLIAEFMGAEIKGNLCKFYKHPIFDVIEIEFSPINWLNYRSSWDWLMPVVEKIESSTNAVFQIYARAIVCIYDYNIWQCNDDRLDLRHQYDFTFDSSKREAVYKAVVEFIKWYNQNK